MCIGAFSAFWLLIQNKKFRTENQLNQGCKDKHVELKKTIETVSEHKVQIGGTEIKIKNIEKDISEIKDTQKNIFSEINKLKTLLISKQGK